MKTEGGLRRPPTLHLLFGFSRLVTNTVCAWTFRGKTTTNRFAGMAPPPLPATASPASSPPPPLYYSCAPRPPPPVWIHGADKKSACGHSRYSRYLLGPPLPPRGEGARRDQAGRVWLGSETKGCVSSLRPRQRISVSACLRLPSLSAVQVRLCDATRQKG